jgi:hypothetical protein
MTSRSNSDRPGGSRGSRRGGGRRQGRGARGVTDGGGDGPDWWRMASADHREFLKTFTTRNEYNRLSVTERGSLAGNYMRSKTAEIEIDSSQTNQLLRRFLISHADPYVAISESHFSKDDSEAVKKASIAYYELSDEKYCQVLGAVDPNHVSVVNAYIWPRHATTDLPLFDLEPSDIHNTQNVLRLQKDIERAFDQRKLTFIHDGSKLCVRILCPDLYAEFLTGTTISFQDIEGRELLFPRSKEPFRRLLAHHCMVAHRHARAMGWTDEDMSEAEVQCTALMAHSLDEEAQRRLQVLWKK